MTAKRGCAKRLSVKQQTSTRLFRLVLSQEPFDKFHALYPIARHGKLIKGEYVFGKIVRKCFERSKLPISRSLIGKKVRHLVIFDVLSFARNEVDLLIAHFSHRHVPATAQQFHAYNILEHLVDGTAIVHAQSLTNAMVNHVEFFVELQCSLSYGILTAHTIEQARLLCGTQITIYRINRHRPPLAF